MLPLKVMAYGIFNIPPAPEPPIYKLFITHAWDHQEYDALTDLIRPDATFRWDNLSVPKENPIGMPIRLPKSIRTLVHELDNRIRQAHCVLIITGMYVAHRQWIQSEIEAALDLHKPIVGVAPRGQERIPETARRAIEEADGELVRWNRESIISAIRRRSGLEIPLLRQSVLVPPVTDGPPAPRRSALAPPTDPPPASQGLNRSAFLNALTVKPPEK